MHSWCGTRHSEARGTVEQGARRSERTFLAAGGPSRWGWYRPKREDLWRLVARPEAALEAGMLGAMVIRPREQAFLGSWFELLNRRHWTHE
ncbi:hypothetical protein HFD88_005952 [Aspergillus terreus]|nr:hypothetical protein HFD88_005952 [Aspergillus terreus]